MFHENSSNWFSADIFGQTYRTDMTKLHRRFSQIVRKAPQKLRNNLPPLFSRVFICDMFNEAPN